MKGWILIILAAGIILAEPLAIIDTPENLVSTPTIKSESQGIGIQSTEPWDRNENLQLKVLVLYNNHPSYTYDQNENGIQDSYELALNYAIKRGIPLENLLGVNCTRGNNYYYYLNTSYQTFLDEIILPVRQKIRDLGEEYIDYIAVMYGIPYRIGVTTTAMVSENRALDSSLAMPFYLNETRKYSTYYGPTNPYIEYSPSIATDKGHFNHTFKYSGSNLYLVSRLDGIDVDEIKDLIYGALYGEKYIYNSPGYYRGIGYVDTRSGDYSGDFSGYSYGYGTYGSGDHCMAYGYSFLENISYPYERQVTEEEIGQLCSCYDGSNCTIAYDAIFYEGWYNYGTYRDGFRWLPGAIACDLNSNSATSLRSSSTSFISNALQAGLTAGVGVTGEPYMAGHARPEIMLYYIIHGYNFAEAAWHSIPYLQWMNHAIGDPIYIPLGDKEPVIDDEFSRNLTVFDETITDQASTARNVYAYLNEGNTPEAALFKLEYGTTESLGTLVNYSIDYRFKEEWNLDSLSSGTTYFYQVTARDALGNTIQTDIQNFTTYSQADVKDHTLTIIQNSTVTVTGDIAFNAITDCASCDIEWSMGDGSTYKIADPTHTYNQPGVYDVFATIIDSNGTKIIERSIALILSPRNLAPVIADTFDGNTTDFTGLSSFGSNNGITLERRGFGRIDFNENIDLRGKDFDNTVFIENNLIGIDTVEESDLNISANITFFGKNLTTPGINKDGVNCTTCTLISNSAGKTAYQVSGFSNYTLVETDIEIHPADTNSDGDVNTTELIVYVEEWKNERVTIIDACSAIEFWKD